MPSTQPDEPLMAPARYIGEHPVRIARQHGPVHASDASGAPLARRDGSLLHAGETLLLPAAEVYGQSYLYDPRGKRDPLYLGVGRCVLPEHADLSNAELSLLGYEFQEGRSDFEPLMPLAQLLALRAPAEPLADAPAPTAAASDASAAAFAKGKKTPAPAADATVIATTATEAPQSQEGAE